MIPIRLFALTFAPLLIQGCAQQAHRPSSVAMYTNSSDTNQIMDELLILFMSTDAIKLNDHQLAPTVGPQLVAGDWLAWQCAFAGNYWDIDTKNAPAYAEALSSGLIK